MRRTLISSSLFLLVLVGTCFGQYCGSGTKVVVIRPCCGEGYYAIYACRGLDGQCLDMATQDYCIQTQCFIGEAGDCGTRPALAQDRKVLVPNLAPGILTQDELGSASCGKARSGAFEDWLRRTGIPATTKAVETGGL